jgi:hypothetical protein
MQVFNQYSAVWICVLVILVAGFVLLQRKPRWLQFLVFGVLVIGLVGAWVLLHPRQTAQVLNATQVQTTIGQGIPVLLEFQSPY